MTADARICRHFGDCGGCSFQDVAYEEQLFAKEASLRELFAPFWDKPTPVAPSPQVWYYRNKVDLTFAPQWYEEPPPPGFQRETVLGFKRKGKWFRPLAVEECRIASPEMERLLPAVRAWQERQGLHAFDNRTKEGFLRILLVREGKRTGQRMVVLVTRPGPFDGPSFVDAVREAVPVDSVQRGVFSGLADVAAAEELELLWGEPVIHEELHVPCQGGSSRNLRFRVSPLSFFQTNTLATEVLYGKIRQWAADSGARRLYDLYGGSGGIAFTCADLFECVLSVENVAEASEDGRRNAAGNGIGNVAFHTEKVKNYLLAELRAGVDATDAAAVLDPPRAGMHPKALRRIVELRPPRILYVSCKPSVFAREMPVFLESYRLDSLQAVDLFPHTPHVEALASFSLRRG